MAIDTTCQRCGKRLRVADEHAGHEARCPNCDTVYTVPSRGTSAVAGTEPMASGREGADSWQMKTPEGLIYGPVTKAELDQWCEQGRITPQCQLVREGEPQWRWASELYPQLAPPEAMSSSGMQTIDPYSPMAMGQPGFMATISPSRYPKAHRGALILILAAVGYMSCCFIVSLVAIVLGVNDLREMKSGQMDPEGRGMTIVGIVLASIWLLGSMIYFGGIALDIAGVFR